MALKDIKNDPSVSSGLKRPLSSLKRRISESSLQYKSRFGKGDKDIDRGSEEHMNICKDLTNTPQVLQDKERNEGFLCKAHISVQGALKKNDGTVSPVLVKEHLPPMPQEIPYSSPDSHGISNMSQSFFADPTVLSENELESAEIFSFKSDKYFSTPMPSKRVKKKLPPVMEVDFESNMSEEWPQQDKASRIDMFQKNFADILSSESPTKTPLYRSFFAAECQEIVNQIENLETEVKRSPGKRKVEECDVSTIDAEPPPYDCTPMKSMLACEVATMIRSLESSPVKEGLSFFGESLLDLEKTDMRLNDFDLSECGIKNNEGHSVGDSEGLSVLRDRLDGLCVKRQKTGPLENIYSEVNSVHQVNKMSPLPNGLPKLTLEMPAIETVCATSKCADEGITAVLTNGQHTEHKISDHITEPDLLVQGTAVASDVSQVIKASLQALVSTTKSLTPAHEGNTTAHIKQLTEEHKLCANITQDIVNYDEMQPTPANVTQVIEILSHISNTTQDLPCSQEEVNIANTTQVIEVPSGNTTQDIVSVNDAAISGNTTQVMDAVSPSANTTQDVTPMHEMVATANTTQIIELGPQFPANTTQDITPMHESKMADTTHEIEVVPQSSLNATQDISSVPVLTANVTQVIEIVPEASPSRAQGTTSTPNEIIGTSCTEDVRGMQKSSMEGLSANEVTSTHLTDAVPSESCSAKESFETLHNDKMPANHHLFGEDTQPSLNMVLDVQAQLGVITSGIIFPSTIGTDTEMSISNQELSAEKKKDLVPPNDHQNGSKHDQIRETLVGVDMKGLMSVEPEAQTSVVDLTRVTINPYTLVSPPAQAKLNVTEGQKLEGYEEPCSNSSTEMASSQKEVDVCKESRTQPLLSESCSMIQEEENAHDLSVFSVGSLSFVTSTPVPGLSNFPFQKTCRESRQQELNVSMGSVLDDSANKVPKQQGMVTLHKSHDAQGLNLNDKEKQTTHGSYLPPSMPKSIPSTSGIPSARRSLALCQNANQNTGRELAVSKIALKGIPGRGMIRPPMARQSLPRPSLGNLKQAVDGTGGTGITSKPTGNRFRTPKVAAAIVKAKSATSPSQLPAGTSSVKPPSRFGAPGSSGRLSIQNVAANLPNTQSTETVSFVRPPISTGIRSGLPRPGASSIRPPLRHAQKVSLKDKAQIQGLPTKKNQRELPTLRRETGSKVESASVVRSTAKQATLALDVTKEASSLQASIQDGASPNHTVQTKAENPNVVQSSPSSKKETASITATSTESAKAGDERCQHLEICKCCHEKYHKLLQEFEDFKRRFDHIQHTQVEMTDMADT